jgi:ATP-binding cassette subfamily B (MDR/TAP) protein 1
MAHVIDIALPLAKPSGSQISPLRSPPSPDHTIADAPESLHNPEIDPKQDSRPLSLLFRILRDHSTPLDHALRAIGIIAAISSGVAPPLMTLVFGSSVDKFNSFGSEEASSQLYDDLSRNALWFLYLFIARFVLVYTYATCFGVTGIRAIRKFRQAFTKSLIRQDVGYLDSQSAGSTTMTISNNADLVENGITEKIGTLLQAISMFVAAFVVAFTQQWALTLVTATTLPVLFAGFYVTFSLGKLEPSLSSPLSKASG